MKNEKTASKKSKSQGKRAPNAAGQLRQSQGQNAHDAQREVQVKAEDFPKFTVKYRPEFCQMLIDHMEQGKSLESFAAKLYAYTDGEMRVCRKTLYNWMKAFPEFQEARDFGHELSLDYWEELGNSNVLHGPSTFNTALYCFHMKNRHGWTDKVEQTHVGSDDKPPIQVESKIDVKTASTEALKDYIRQETHGG